MLGQLEVPVEGGSANDYDYANQDCVNNYDLDGRNVVSRALDRAAGSKWLGRFNKCMSTYKKFADAYKGMMAVGSVGLVAEGSNHYEHGKLNRAPLYRNMPRGYRVASRAAGVTLVGIFVAGFGAYGGQTGYCEYAAFRGRTS